MILLLYHVIHDDGKINTFKNRKVSVSDENYCRIIYIDG